MAPRKVIPKKPKFSKAKTWNPSNYSKKEKIGEGSFGKVYRALVKPSNAICALKILKMKRNWKCDDIKAEFFICKEANHDNVVRCKEVYGSSLRCIIVMDFCEMGDLNDFIYANRPNETANDRNIRATLFTSQIASGVDYLQSKLGYIHMDLKPRNILMAGPNCVKISDFGCAVKTDYGRRAHSYEDWKGGTPQYSPPEILTSSRRVIFDTTADVWAIGCIAYEILTRQVAFYIDCDFGDDDSQLKSALRRMKLFQHGQFPIKMYKTVQDNTHAVSFFRQVFASRKNRPLVRALNQFAWFNWTRCWLPWTQ